MTHVLLELCRLKGWALAGMSVDYKKIFDLIPQAVVLRVAAELGMAPTVYRALGACTGSSGGHSSSRGA